jgi:hypothetical protein
VSVVEAGEAGSFERWKRSPAKHGYGGQARKTTETTLPGPPRVDCREPWTCIDLRPKMKRSRT